MQLNTLSPALGAKKAPKRKGRGIGSTDGKTAGRGHKGQTSRSGGSIRIGFEGGQNPMYRRLPKFGFTSRVGRQTIELRLNDIAKVEGDVVDFLSLQSSGLVGNNIRFAKIFDAGEITRPVTVRGIRVSKGARAKIEACGGKVED